MKKFLKSMKYALSGLNLFFKERNAKIELTVALLYSTLAFLLDFNLTQWCIALLCFGGVLTAEALNSSIERLVDMVSPEYNEKAGIVKDIAAGAVLLISIAAAIIGVILVLQSLQSLGYLTVL